jgi:hypothetical protein
MGTTCCKVALNPTMIHVKKLNEIFVNCKSDPIHTKDTKLNIK